MAVLFSERDPAKALLMPESWQAPQNPSWPEGVLWHRHEVQFLRALEYQGDRAAAAQLFAALATADPPSGWSVLAGER